jgi:hypothetical protein
MQMLVGALVFCAVLFAYLHVHFHWKTCDDLEVLEVDNPSKDELEEVCDLRQPLRFKARLGDLERVCSRSQLRDAYGAFDVKVRDLSISPTQDEELHLPVSLANALGLIEDDTRSRYLVESSGEFLEETGLAKAYRTSDELLRPYMVASCAYDLLTGSHGARSPFRYHVDYRNYYVVTEGEVSVKMAPPRNGRYLREERDYENFEFRSPIDPWDESAEARAALSKVKCLEVKLRPGDVLYIPAYWWHSVRYGECSTVCCMRYRTYMNTVAILPRLIMRVLQAQNVKRLTAAVAADDDATVPTETDRLSSPSVSASGARTATASSM